MTERLNLEDFSPNNHFLSFWTFFNGLDDEHKAMVLDISSRRGVPPLTVLKFICTNFIQTLELAEANNATILVDSLTPDDLLQGKTLHIELNVPPENNLGGFIYDAPHLPSEDNN